MLPAWALTATLLTVTLTLGACDPPELRADCTQSQEADTSLRTQALRRVMVTEKPRLGLGRGAGTSLV